MHGIPSLSMCLGEEEVKNCKQVGLFCPKRHCKVPDKQSKRCQQGSYSHHGTTQTLQKEGPLRQLVCITLSPLTLLWDSHAATSTYTQSHLGDPPSTGIKVAIAHERSALTGQHLYVVPCPPVPFEVLNHTLKG